MKKPLKTITTGALLMLPALSLALGLGDIDVKSKLNEPLRAEIRLLYGDAEEIAATTVELASPEDFDRVGLDSSSLAFQLEFQIERGESGDFVVLVSSDMPISEPFLDFLIEVNWANGRLLREYVVLLDPPVIAPAAGPQVTPVSELPRLEPTPTPSTSDDEPPAVVDSTPAISEPSSSTSYPSGDNTYGPVVSGDTLWEIARDWRPSGDISINQMMILMYQMNPDAFYQDNISALKRGAVLRLPSADDFNSLSQSEATSEVRSQNQMWESYRLASASRTPTVSDAGVSPDYDSYDSDDRTPADSRLELVPPSGQSTSDADYGTGADAMQADIADMRVDLQRTREDLISATQENAEMRSRVADLEDLVTNLERMITLKDADLADLQYELDMARQGVADIGAEVENLADTADTGYDSSLADTGFDDTAADPTADTGFDSGMDDSTSSDPADTGYDDDGYDDDVASDTTPDTGTAAVTPPPTVVAPPTRAKDSGGIMSMLLNPFVIGGLALVLAGIGAVFWQRRRQAQAGESLIDAMMDDEEEYVPPAPEPVHEPEPTSDPVAATAIAPVLSEDSLIDAIQANPDDPQSHLALLRMYYSENEKDKFIAAAEKMENQIGSTHPAWGEVKGMGSTLAADHRMFSAGGAAEDAEEPELDLQGSSMPKSDPEDEFSLDLDLGDDDDSSGSGDAGLDLSLDLDDDAEPEGTDEFTLDLDGDAEQDDDDSLDLDLDGEDDPDLDLDGDGDSSDAGTDTADEIEGLDFDLDGSDEAAAEEEPATVGDHTEFEIEAVSEPIAEPESADDEADDLDLDDMDLDLSMDSLDEPELTDSASEDAAADDHLDDLPSADDLDDLDLDNLDLGEENLAGEDDAVGTKLDLAKAYIDMGDPDGARGMLEEVIGEGSDEQKEEAQKLLSDLS
jgi:pilus assembly protein FimV